MNRIEILRRVRSKIEAHNEFKKEYNKLLAFDFNVLNFFQVDENKISEILAFFLDPNETHGQGKKFIQEFVKYFCSEEIDISKVRISTEEVITGNRRIDLYIEFKNFVIAIENKLWAKDQKNQLKVYTEFLDRNWKGKYLLLYLNPYKSDPSIYSINQRCKEKLENSNKLKIISYKNEIFELLNRWQSISEAENVSFFIKQLKQYLKTMFIGNNTLNMTQNMKELVLKNHTEVEALINVYKEIEEEVFNKIEQVRKNFNLNDLEKKHPNIKFIPHGLFNYEGCRYFKIGVSKNYNRIWLSIKQSGIKMYSEHYTEFVNIPSISYVLNLNDNLELDDGLSVNEIIDIYKKQLEIAIEFFEK